MQEQNPDFKYYRKLAGTWKNADRICEIVLTDTVGITVSYGGAVLLGHYGVFPVDPSYWGGQQQSSPMLFSGMMGFTGGPVSPDQTTVNPSPVPAAQTAAPADGTKCIYCGADVTGKKFCTECGGEVRPVSSQ